MQTFTLINLYTKEKKIIEGNFNIHPTDIIKTKMQSYIHDFEWNIDGKYVAIGSYGDSVIYNNGSIDLVADSG